MARYVPGFSQEAWSKVLEASPDALHPGLAFYRFFEMDQSESKTRKALERVSRIKLPEAGYLLDRQAEHAGALERSGWAVCRWRQTTQSRLACGLGIPSLCENGLFLDRISGVPYLPGSALKGIAKDRARLDLPEEPSAALEHKKMMTAVFGSHAVETRDSNTRNWDSARGHVTFLDAFPDFSKIEAPFKHAPFEIDIINPHYDEYYSSQGKKPPADYISPNPSLFLTLREGIPFHFALAARRADFQVKGHLKAGVEVKYPAKALEEAARSWLQKALQDLGVGGKTSVGYGSFGPPSECLDPA